MSHYPIPEITRGHYQHPNHAEGKPANHYPPDVVLVKPELLGHIYYDGPYLPEKLKEGHIYIHGSKEEHGHVYMQCPHPQCAHIIAINCAQNALWQCHEEPDGTLTISPSIKMGSLNAHPCHVHYFVRSGRIVWHSAPKPFPWPPDNASASSARIAPE